ncbi:MAG: clostripain [Bacteroidaceae bacterium]|nr:clostripain [Bacteroidaceae bacterium]
MMRIKAIFRYTMYTMFILLGMTSCHWFNPEDETIYDRTVLVYMAADNNLSAFQKEDVDEMLKGAADIPTNCRLLVYVDDTKLPRILSIEQEKGRRPVAKVVQQYTTEHNSGDTETLLSAIEWATTNYPAESYGLVLWSHGSAWVPAKAPVQRAICVDSNNWMEIKDIADVLAQSPHLDFILFDACFMQSVEVAYELREVADYIISSPAEIPGPGAPYHRIVASMFSTPLNVQGIAEEYYREYHENNIYVRGHEPDCFGVCLSVVDCSGLEHLAAATDKMIKKYAGKGISTDLSTVQRYYPRTSNTTPEYYDMNGYMRQLITLPEDYEYWKSSFDHTIPYRKTTPQWFSDYSKGLEDIVDMENYGGISCYVPKEGRTRLNEAFRSTSWYHAAGWEQAGW